MRTDTTGRDEQLFAVLADLGRRAVDAMDQATEALLQADLPLAEQVLAARAGFDAAAAECDGHAAALLAGPCPSGIDPLRVLSAVRAAPDLQRMGALAAEIAAIAARNHPEHTLPEEVGGHVAEMGRIAVALAERARAVLASRDLRHAAHLRDAAAAMDDLHRHLTDVLTGGQWRHGVPAAVDLTLIGRAYLRFADHAADAAQRVAGASPGTEARGR